METEVEIEGNSGCAGKAELRVEVQRLRRTTIPHF